MTIDEAYRQAFDLHVAGKLREAETVYRQILQQVPNHVGALHMLGTMGMQVGQVQQGADLIEKALKINPNIPGSWANLAEAKRLLKKHDEAIECFKRAIEQEPEAPEPYNNLGILYQEMKRLDDAIASFRRAVALDPQRGEMRNNLAGALAEKEQHEAAVVEYRKAVEVLPGHPEIHLNLGTSLERLCQFEAAEKEFRRAIEIRPDYGDAWSNLAAVDMRNGRFDDAKLHIEKALSFDPNHPGTQWTKSLYELMHGDYLSGFALHESRWRVKGLRPLRPFKQPMWDGSPLNGRTILIHHEQAFGDMLQCARFIPMVAQRGGRVIVEIQRELFDLFKTVEGVTKVIAVGEAIPDFDVFAPMFSLPSILKVTLETLPNAVPYFKTDPARIVQMKQLLASAGGKKVGIAWWGRWAPDPARSIHTDLLGPIVDVVRECGAHLLSLQLPMHDLPPAKIPMQAVDLAPHLKSFADTAAALEQIDLMVTLDSAIAHLAGAMARPTLVMLPYAPDWRWMRGRDDSPWYPTMKLFRQTQPRHWKPVIARLVEEIKARLA